MEAAERGSSRDAVEVSKAGAGSAVEVCPRN